MSRESHRLYLEGAALREAQRAFTRKEQVNVRDFLRLRIQTVEPWKRIFCILIGCGFAAMAAWLSIEHAANIWVVGFLAVLSLVSLVVGIIGWKRPVEAILDGTADTLLNRLLDIL